jgi:hypothetical protein
MYIMFNAHNEEKEKTSTQYLYLFVFKLMRKLLTSEFVFTLEHRWNKEYNIV